MNSIRIEFNTENAAFNEFDGAYYYEVARILRELADKFENGQEPQNINDINGNSIGECIVE
jgi:hypothetical protein